MTTKLEEILVRYEKLNTLVADPEVIKNIEEWRGYTKELSAMEEIVEKFKEYKKAEQEKRDAEESLLTETDPEMKEFLQDEVQSLKEQLAEITVELKTMLIPKD